jgi:hypothetical protein
MKSELDGWAGRTPVAILNARDLYYCNGIPSFYQYGFDWLSEPVWRDTLHANLSPHAGLETPR